MLNRLTNLVDAAGTNVYRDDAAGQMLSEGGLCPNDTVSITYANRLRASLGIASPTGSEWSQTYGYDATRRLASTSSPAPNPCQNNQGLFCARHQGVSIGIGRASSRRGQTSQRLIKSVTMPTVG